MASLTRILFRVPHRTGVARREFSALVSATEEFPGLPIITPQPTVASTPSVSTLSNGVIVVSESASATTTVTLTYPKAGSANEGMAEAGASLVNKCLAFKSGSGVSTTLILRNMEDDGALSFRTADRTSATLGYTCAPEKAVRLIPLLATDCSFEKWDVFDAKASAATEIEDAGSSPQVILTERIYAAAYGAQSPMGRPFYCADASTEAIKSFRARAYGLKGAVLAATGISDHAAFVADCEERLSESPIGVDSEVAAASYLGGEARVHASSTGFANVALAFEGPSSSVLASVVKKCLELMGSSAFAAPGLVGVYGGADSAAAGSMVDALCTSISKPSPDIIKRAKTLAKAEAVFSLEGGSKSLAEIMTKTVVETGAFGGVAASYDAVTDKSVAAFFDKMLKSNVSMAAVGDLSYVPYHATVASKFS